MLNRQEFIEIFDPRVHAELDTSPLWIPEIDGQPSKWFVCVAPLALESSLKQEYWDWINNHCRGQVRCYSSNSEDREEWWGFTEESDIVLWILRWA